MHAQGWSRRYSGGKEDSGKIFTIADAVRRLEGRRLLRLITIKIKTDITPSYPRYVNICPD